MQGRRFIHFFIDEEACFCLSIIKSCCISTKFTQLISLISHGMRGHFHINFHLKRGLLDMILKVNLKKLM